MQALGMIETKGTLASIEAADVMLKTADVRLVKKEKVTGGLIMVSVVGDVAAVKAAVDSGKSAVENLGGDLLYGNHVIPRPDFQLEGFYKKKKKPDDPKGPSGPTPDPPQSNGGGGPKITDDAPKGKGEPQKAQPEPATTSTKQEPVKEVTLEEVTASKDREEIKAFLEYMSVAKLTELSKKHQFTDIDSKKLKKKDLVERIVDHFMKE